MSCKSNRLFFTLSNKKLRRARRLYVYLCIPAMEEYGNEVVQYMAIKMMANGLYADHDKSGRSTRQGIGNTYFRLTKHRYDRVSFHWNAWHEWCAITNWCPYSGNYINDRPLNKKEKYSIPAVISDICFASPVYEEIWQ